MDSLKDIIKERKKGERNKYISREYQHYGYRLAMELSDEKHKSLYIKLAKETDRVILEKCRTFALDSKADRKGALFMWKLKKLRQDLKMSK